MTNKQFNIGLVAVTLAALLAAFLLTGFSGSVSVAVKESDSASKLVGTWKDDTSPDIMNVTFTKGGVFQITGTDAAKYTADAEAGTITLVYASEYGGQTIVYNYTLSENDTKLAMTDTSTGTTNNYTKSTE
ncbi:MAG: hypothetical protein ACOYB8_01965 [Eubacteriaceae bacterium]|jgi:hypothetical protein